jgi:hypothetical protein
VPYHHAGFALSWDTIFSTLEIGIETLMSGPMISMPAAEQARHRSKARA